MAVNVIDLHHANRRAQPLKKLRTLFAHHDRFLVCMYDVYYDGNGKVSVTLDYMDRGSLSDAVRDYDRMPVPVVRHVVRDCLSGLSYLHRNRVMHGAFKTAKIFLSRRARSDKLSDYGFVRNLVQSASFATFLGTLVYMSAERLHSGIYIFVSDVWGLGISLFECIRGDYPFEKQAYYFGYIESTMASPTTLIAGLASPALVGFISQCTCIVPDSHATVSALHKHPWLNTGTTTPATTPPEDEGAAGSQALCNAERVAFVAWLDRMDEVGAAAGRCAAAALDSARLHRPRR